MEITVEVSGEEYKAAIRKYYIKRNWTAWIAIIAAISFALSVWELIKSANEWSWILEYFVVAFVTLILLFLAIPYGVLYLEMLGNTKKIGDEPITWHYRIEDKGVNINNGQLNKLLPWRILKQNKNNR